MAENDMDPTQPPIVQKPETLADLFNLYRLGAGFGNGLCAIGGVAATISGAPQPPSMSSSFADAARYLANFTGAGGFEQMQEVKRQAGIPESVLQFERSVYSALKNQSSGAGATTPTAIDEVGQAAGMSAPWWK